MASKPFKPFKPLLLRFTSDTYLKAFVLEAVAAAIVFAVVFEAQHALPQHPPNAVSLQRMLTNALIVGVATMTVLTGLRLLFAAGGGMLTAVEPGDETFWTP